MDKQRLSLRIETSRVEKLRLYARYKRKTMTQLVEDWIDTLEMPNYNDTEG
ncbi:hypothetical protein PCC7418_2503 [Halothece sp. PCC 7418]|nr:hypothetical protein PCC7418_0860 [Halothece sp. PCC 7418]AFZ43446.1 hypothetical protein PCC7418_1246 [Halothece sp. PCC 7418]AFZ44650.1 hypothetical protein PCC7418_2503 [Halothece sp. PCC 7418]